MKLHNLSLDTLHQEALIAWKGSPNMERIINASHRHYANLLVDVIHQADHRKKKPALPRHIAKKIMGAA